MKTDAPPLLNLASWQTDIQSLGPGKRFGLWVQGCPFSCPGCIAPDWIPFRVNQAMTVLDMKDVILQEDDIEGLTISGGEPMMQAGRLALLIQMLRAVRPELNVILYTGFTHRQLVWEEAEDLLKHVDVLIAGPYVAEKNDNHGLRGSSNQEILFLTDTLLPYKEMFMSQPRSLEVHIRSDMVSMTGIPEQHFRL